MTGPAFPFPGWRHLPGTTDRADLPPLHAATATVPARFEASPPASHPAIRYGIALCEAGFYWEAHEVLEAVWTAMAPNSRDRLAVQAVIQLANAGLKQRMGRSRAALRLLAEVGRLLGEVGPPRAGSNGLADWLDATALRAATARTEAAIAAGRADARLPQLRREPATKCMSTLDIPT